MSGPWPAQYEHETSPRQGAVGVTEVHGEAGVDAQLYVLKPFRRPGPGSRLGAVADASHNPTTRDEPAAVREDPPRFAQAGRRVASRGV